MTSIVLLRAVNVSGTQLLPMAAWRARMLADGLGNPETYIQSGNAVVESPMPPDHLAASVRAGILAGFGFAPDVLVRSPAELVSALHNHPFAGADSGRVYAYFLAEPTPTVDAALLDALRVGEEAWALGPGVLWLYLPAGVGKSKLADKLPRAVRCVMTARNLKTVAALVAMAERRASAA